MKKLLVLTDLTSNGSGAESTALLLAQKLHTLILLYYNIALYSFDTR